MPDVYERLRERLDQLPVPYPRTETRVEIRLLQALFTEDEAAIALHMSALTEPAEVIHRRLLRATRRQVGSAGPQLGWWTNRRRERTPGPRSEGPPAGAPSDERRPRDQERRTPTLPELRAILNEIARRGAINTGATTRGGKTVRTYGLAPLVVGMFEFQVDRLTPAFVQDFQAYLDEGFREAFVGARTAQIRTVPVNKALPSARAVGTYDDIRAYVESHPGPFAVRNCVCRQSAEIQSHPCTTSTTAETCLTVGVAAHRTVDGGSGRYIEREEILSLLDLAEAEGHVLQPQNTREPSFICCCCRDCCEVLQNARKLPRPADAVSATHQAAVDRATCIGCNACARRCPMDAIAVTEKVAHVDTTRCIGCGLCVGACPTGAVSLERRPTTPAPARTPTGMYLRIIKDRFGVSGVVRTAVNKVLGRKV